MKVNTDADFQVYPDSLNEIQPRQDEDDVNRETDGVDEDKRAGPTWEGEMDLDDVDVDRNSSAKPPVNSSVHVDLEEATKSAQSKRCYGPDEPHEVREEEAELVGPARPDESQTARSGRPPKSQSCESDGDSADDEQKTVTWRGGAGQHLLAQLMVISLAHFIKGKVHDRQKFYFIPETFPQNMYKAKTDQWRSAQISHQAEELTFNDFLNYFKTQQVQIFSIFSSENHFLSDKPKFNFLMELLPDLSGFGKLLKTESFESDGILLSLEWSVMLLAVESSRKHIVCKISTH